MDLEGAIGTISPTPAQAERIEELFDFLATPRAFRPAGATVADCMDGRPAAGHAAHKLHARLPGGTLILALTAHEVAGGNLRELSERIGAALVEMSEPIGVHNDDHHLDPSEDNGVGCAAIQAWDTVTATAREKSAEIAALAAKLDRVAALPETAPESVEAASGFEVFTALTNAAADVPVLEGSHLEAAVVINLQDGTSLAKEGVYNATDGELQTFCLDLWSINHNVALLVAALPELAGREAELDAAMTALSLATPLVLCGPGMPVYINN